VLKFEFYHHRALTTLRDWLRAYLHRGLMRPWSIVQRFVSTKSIHASRAGLILGLLLVLTLTLAPDSAWAGGKSPNAATAFRPRTVAAASRQRSDHLAQAGATSTRSAIAASSDQPEPQTRVAAATLDLNRSELPADMQRIRDRGKLVVAVLGVDNPPFFMELADGQLGGLDIELAHALADQLGVDLELNRSAQTFDEVVDQVYNLEADLAISKISRTLARGQRVRFSQPYLAMRQGLLVNRLQLAQQSQNRRTSEAIRTLAGRVGVIQNSSYVGFLNQKFPQATVVEMPTWDDAVQAVTRGEILAAYRDELEVKKVMLLQPDASLNLQTVALTDTQDQLAMVLPWDSNHLLSWVDLYLSTQEETFTVDKVLDDYADYWSAQNGA
jgi:polar amino acid transport system substrate-binding protein